MGTVVSRVCDIDDQMGGKVEDRLESQEGRGGRVGQLSRQGGKE